MLQVRISYLPRDGLQKGCVLLLFLLVDGPFRWELFSLARHAEGWAVGQGRALV